MSKLGKHLSFKLATTSWSNCQDRGVENGGRSRRRFYNYNLDHIRPSSSWISQSSYGRGKCTRFSHYLPIILLFLITYLNVWVFTCAISINSYEGMFDPFPQMKSLDQIRIKHQCVFFFLSSRLVARAHTLKYGEVGYPGFEPWPLYIICNILINWVKLTGISLMCFIATLLQCILNFWVLVSYTLVAK